LPRRKNIKARITERLHFLQLGHSRIAGVAPSNVKLEPPPPLPDVFGMARLDWKDDRHWRILLFIMASEVFPLPSRPGAKRKWTPERLGQLVDDFLVLKEANRRKPLKTLAELFLKAGKYPEIRTESRLLRLLYEGGFGTRLIPDDRASADGDEIPYEPDIMRDFVRQLLRRL
jgi:hypothetical protein